MKKTTKQEFYKELQFKTYYHSSWPAEREGTIRVCCSYSGDTLGIMKKKFANKYEYYLPSKIVERIEKEEAKQFIKHVDEERERFVKVARTYSVALHNELRTSIDSLLITYDQMKKRII